MSMTHYTINDDGDSVAIPEDQKHDKDYSDGRTKQSFRDSVDVNRILQRAARAGTLSHLERHGGQYGDFSNFDFFRAQNMLARARQIFEALPGEIRREFDQDPKKFFDYVNNPQNADRLAELLPQLAQPGRTMPTVARGPGGRGPQASREVPEGDGQTPPATSPQTEGEPAGGEQGNP